MLGVKEPIGPTSSCNPIHQLSIFSCKHMPYTCSFILCAILFIELFTNYVLMHYFLYHICPQYI